MSFEMFGICSKLNLPTKEKFVLLCIASVYNDQTKLAFPSHEYIQGFTGLSKDSVLRAIKSLISLNLIKKEERFRKNGSQTSNMYSFNEQLIHEFDKFQYKLEKEFFSREEIDFLKEKENKNKREAVHNFQRRGVAVSDGGGSCERPPGVAVSDPILTNNINYKINNTMSSKLDDVFKKYKEEKFDVTEISKKSIKEQCIFAIAYLDKIANKNFPPNKPNLEAVEKLFKLGYTLGQVIRVIELKTKEWGSNQEFKKYLRPGTLFSKKFSTQYVGEIEELTKNKSIEQKSKIVRSKDEYVHYVKQLFRKWYNSLNDNEKIKVDEKFVESLKKDSRMKFIADVFEKYGYTSVEDEMISFCTYQTNFKDKILSYKEFSEKSEV